MMSELKAAAPKIQSELRVVPLYQQSTDFSPFKLPENISRFPTESSRNELELTLGWQGINANTVFRNEIIDGQSPNNSVVFNEIYFEGVIKNHDLSLGKKIYSYGVGFGFRPLDVIQRENRRQLYTYTLEGVPAIAWYHFREKDAFTLIFSNPGNNNSIQSKKDESLTLRYYKLQGNADIHALMRISDRNKIEIGSGFSFIINNQMELHSSLLYQQRGEQLVNALTTTIQTLATNNPMQLVSINNQVKALLGISFTSEQGWSLLTEAWYDGEAYTTKQWQDLTMLTQQQRLLQSEATIPSAAINNNVNASSQSFSPVNLLRWNTLFRVSYDSEQLDSNLEILYTPEDKGYVATLNSVYEVEEHRFHLSIRQYGGPSNAAYQQLPVDWALLVAWEWIFI